MKWFQDYVSYCVVWLFTKTRFFFTILDKSIRQRKNDIMVTILLKNIFHIVVRRKRLANRNLPKMYIFSYVNDQINIIVDK